MPLDGGKQDRCHTELKRIKIVQGGAYNSDKGEKSIYKRG